MAKRMTARYPGDCPRCDVRIQPGDEIVFDGRARHAECPRAERPESDDLMGPAEPPAQRVGELGAAHALFDRAREHLRFPKVRLTTDAGREVVLSVAGERSRRPGTLNVADDLPYGEPGRRWYGRIERDGTWGGASAPCDVLAIVAAFAAEPAKVAAEYGRMTGSCCFCGRRLTDERSTEVGYGPVCAGHYGLPWG